MNSEEFVARVVNSYVKGKGIFINRVNAEEMVPRGLKPLQKSQYIFYVLQLDYAMKSQILYRGANVMCKNHPDFFTPSHLSKLSDEQLREELQKNLHPRYINEAVRRYRHNTWVLTTDYCGDPRKIFTSSKSCKEIILRLKFFRGFGPKVGNFFVRTMINTFGYSYKDVDLMLPPVDVHDVRIAYMLGYTKTQEMTPTNINFVKQVWSRACLEAGKSWLIFDKALWLLGSEGKPKSADDIMRLLDGK